MINSYKQIAAAVLLLTACTSNLPGDNNNNLPPEEKGEPVSISFDMYTAEVTKATTATAPEPMAEGKTFRIYAYNSKAGSTPDFAADAPVASAVYTVGKGADGKPTATGDLKLYRGTYYMYLVSYNEETSYPELNGGKITVTNGKDFMYTTLENIVVQPTTPGGNSMTVALPSPFVRMGSQVVVRAKTKASSPVAVTTLKVVDIKVSGLPTSLDYQFGETAWEACTAYDADYTYPGTEFKRYAEGSTTTESNDVTAFWTSPAKVLLPVDGSNYLKFDVKLEITYSSGTQNLTEVYPASIQKVLLPGMAYVFDFTLTFYGKLVPSDLTLALREYNTIPLESDGLGE